ncbi:GNAT family N-acetyltransferase [Falsibacillus pallidus]|uniref:Acetyltransferase (GNAT) family protein n=1 Tax=Falsibacillus pallidus TaxID=493781 RepID=A0A370GVB3_9BACI|nr:GNAT family N-acetyltransferase [Falsibacillus pallidus]RDI47607.1 acetyltransferase (GNAT) family protein [Falsibacillus pallidus]
MKKNELISRSVGTEDVLLLEQWTKCEDNWLKEELSGFTDVNSFFEYYRSLEGEWRIWENIENEEAIGLTYHMCSAPSNQKPWLGTIVTSPAYRNNRLGRGIIDALGEEMKRSGHKALFAGVPIQQYSWIDFLNKCLFEQLKVESNQKGQFMVMARPL